MEGIEKQLAEQLKQHTSAQKEKLQELEAAIEKGAKSEVVENQQKSFDEAQEATLKMQEQLDNISTSIKKQSEAQEKTASQDIIAEVVKENFNEISKVDKSHPFNIELKDMTLPSNLVGDQPRDYNNDVVRRRPQGFINVRDLARTFPIIGGTYTFTRSELSSGTVGNQTEGQSKNELEYTYTMVDANTDYIAGFSVYSKKMRNNLPWLQATLGADLRDDYTRGENSVGNSILEAEATASTQVITGQNEIEMLIAEIATLADNDVMANGIVMRPSNYYTILITQKSLGAGYGLPGVVTFDNGVLRINGIPIYIANWIEANKYYVGNWERFSQPVTEGFSFDVSEDDSDNFRKNNITARVEQQTTFAVERPTDIIFGDFTAV